MIYLCKGQVRSLGPLTIRIGAINNIARLAATKHHINEDTLVALVTK